MIHLKNIVKKYGSHRAVDGITATFYKGRIYGLLGPNGSGKSTTLKMIAGLIHPTSGQISVNNKEVTRKIASDIAYLADGEMLYKNFTIKQMIEFFTSQFSDFQTEKAKELLSFMKLQPNQKIKSLSKGQRGRLKLVLTLSRKVPIVLLDEPFSGLDPMVRESIVKGLVSFVDFGEQTVIIATHEVDEIEPILEEAFIINNGQILNHCDVEVLREEQGLSVLQWLKSQSYQ